MDKIYVVHYNGKMYKDLSWKGFYETEVACKIVITQESKKKAEFTYDGYFHELPEEEKKELIEEERAKFEIVEYTPDKSTYFKKEYDMLKSIYTANKKILNTDKDVNLREKYCLNNLGLGNILDMMGALDLIGEDDIDG